MSLDVYLYGQRVGTLAPVGAGLEYEFAYSDAALEHYGRGVALLSASLPTTDEPFSPDASRAFVEGLLPEGMRRLQLARELEIDRDDGYAMLAALGGDCVGGACFRPPAESSPAAGEGGTSRLVEEGELEELVTAPPTRLLDERQPRRMRAALPGGRHKISLARRSELDRWVWPDADLPSTHIVKPENGEHPEMVVNEMFCTSVVAEAGLPVAPTTIETFAGRPCVVSERFDRAFDGAGDGRLHQESFCQALGFAPDVGLESDDVYGPGFAEAAGLLRAVGAGDRVPDLIAVALCNYMLGNGDCHGENLALMHTPRRSLLAPFYDIVSTAVYDDPTHVGMVIADDYDETAYLLELAQISEEARIGLERCRQIAASISARVGAALQTVAGRARREGWYAPVIEGIVDLAGERAVNLGYEVQY